MNEPEKPPVLAQVTPRYLAGGGDPRWVTAPLQKAFRWQPAHIPLSPVVRLTRRDRQAELLLSPDPDEHWWTLHHTGTTAGEKAWTMRFGARTPAEIIAAATDALNTGPADSAADPMQVLEQAGWKRSVLEHQISSPDGFVTVSRHPLGALHIEVTAHDGPWTSEPTARTAWRAYFSDHTPPHLAAAVLAGMVSTEPLLRDEKEIAPSCATASASPANAFPPIRPSTPCGTGSTASPPTAPAHRCRRSHPADLCRAAPADPLRPRPLHGIARPCPSPAPPPTATT